MTEEVKPCKHGRNFCMECHYNKDAPRSTLPEMYDKLQADYDALHAEAEALRVALLGIASVNPAERGIEWAKAYASDGLKGSGSELYARWLDAFNEAEALRAENGRLTESLRVAHHNLSVGFDTEASLTNQLEAARGLLREAKELRNAVNIYPGRTVSAWSDSRTDERIDAFLTATPAPEVRHALSGDISDQDWINAGCPPEVRQDGHACEINRAMDGSCFACKAEQGERQKPVGHVYTMQPCFPGEPMRAHAQLHVALPAGTKLYTTPQPAPDVSALVDALESAQMALMGYTHQNSITMGALGKIRESLAGWRQPCPATANPCPTCPGTCAEICAKARP